MCSAARSRRWTASARRSWASTACCAASQEQGIGEVILALGATVDGQTTSHYLAERLQPLGCTVTRLGHGVPVGRRAHLSRRGHARRGPARPPAGRLTGRRQVLTSRQLFTPGTSPPPWPCSRSCRPRILSLKTKAKPVDAGGRGPAPAGRRHVRDHVQGPRHRARGPAGRRLGAADRARRRRRRGAAADDAGQPRDRLALGRAGHCRGGLPQPARPVRRRDPAAGRSRSAT